MPQFFFCTTLAGATSVTEVAARRRGRRTRLRRMLPRPRPPLLRRPRQVLLHRRLSDPRPPSSQGQRVTAFFSTDVEGGDAEVLLLPPNRAERQSLAAYAGSPNLDEHFSTAFLMFSPEILAQFTEQIQSNGARKAPEMGALLDSRYSPLARNIASSFNVRLTWSLLAPESNRGFFVALISGKKLGNFDVVVRSTGRPSKSPSAPPPFATTGPSSIPGPVSRPAQEVRAPLPQYRDIGLPHQRDHPSRSFARRRDALSGPARIPLPTSCRSRSRT